MPNDFNTLINSYIENDVGIDDDFLSVDLAASLRQNLLKLFDSDKLFSAGTGNGAIAVQNKTMRSDVISWLDRVHNDVFEDAFLDLMDSFILHLNNTCYTGISSCEFHYTLYQPGSFYKKHIDVFRNDDSRQFSMIIYLNASREPGDGGELCIHHPDHLQNISPDNRRAIFFKSSEMAHEVLPTATPRMSITGWLKK